MKGFESIKWFDKLIANTMERVYLSINEKYDKKNQQKKIEQLKDDYLNDLNDKIGAIQIPYMSKPRRISDLFVDLFVHSGPKNWSLGFDSNRMKLIKTRNLLSEFKHIVILGEPGAGKTTLIRRISQSICTNNNSYFFKQHKIIFPIIIECRDSTVVEAYQEYELRKDKIEEARTKRYEELLEKNEKSKASKDKLWEFVNREFPMPNNPFIIFMGKELKKFEFPYPESFILKLLQGNKLFLLIDGLDEAPISVRRQIADGLELFRSKYPGNLLMLSCRTAEIENLVPKGFDIFEIAPLNEAQKASFVKRWFLKDREKVDEFLAKLSDSHLWEISDRPLLLTMLCSLYKKSGNMPRYRVDIYRECSDLALRHWDSFRDVKRESFFKDLSFNQRVNILSEISSQMTKDGVFLIASESLIQKIRVVMQEASIQGNPEDLLNEIVAHSGLLMQIALNNYSFSHKSFQEYFSAYFFSFNDHMLPIKRYMKDRQWLSTAEMTACMVPDASDIILYLTDSLTQRKVEDIEAIKFAMRMVYQNPLTLKLKGREKIIKRLLSYLQGVGQRTKAVVVYDRERFKVIHGVTFKNYDYLKINEESSASIYIYFNKPRHKNYLESKTHMIARGITLLFLLLVPSPDLAYKLLSTQKSKFGEFLMLSAILHGDRNYKESGQINNSVLGKKLMECLVPLEVKSVN